MAVETLNVDNAHSCAYTGLIRRGGKREETAREAARDGRWLEKKKEFLGSSKSGKWPLFMYFLPGRVGCDGVVDGGCNW